MRQIMSARLRIPITPLTITLLLLSLILSLRKVNPRRRLKTLLKKSLLQQREQLRKVNLVQAATKISKARTNSTEQAVLTQPRRRLRRRPMGNYHLMEELGTLIPKTLKEDAELYND